MLHTFKGVSLLLLGQVLSKFCFWIESQFRNRKSLLAWSPRFSWADFQGLHASLPRGGESKNGESNRCDSLLCTVGHIPTMQVGCFYISHLHTFAHPPHRKQEALAQFKDTFLTGKSTQGGHRAGPLPEASKWPEDSTKSHIERPGRPHLSPKPEVPYLCTNLTNMHTPVEWSSLATLC